MAGLLKPPLVYSPPRSPAPGAPASLRGGTYEGNPVFLSSSITLQSPSTSGVNADALRNPFAGPMEILEIRIGLRAVDNSAAGSGTVDGGAIGLQLALDSGIPVTSAPIPVWLFDKERNIGAEQMAGQGTTPFAYAEYTWRLAHPFWIESGETLVPTLQHFAAIKPSVFARVSYGCRSVQGKKRPRVRKIPYAASWQSKVFNAYGAVDTDQSSESDIVNRSGSSLTLTRMVGRINGFNLTGTSQVLVGDATAGATSVPSEDMRGRLLQITKMVDSQGNQLVRDPTLFGTVFPGLGRSWEIRDKVVVPPDWYVLTYLNKLAPVVTPSGTFQAQAHISAVGWREVAL